MAKNKSWVLYKDIKERVSIEMVLRHYGIFDKLKPAGNNLTGCCPIHGGSNPRQFSVSLERNVFNCFGDCKAGGNVFDLVSRLEGISIRESALKLQNLFLVGSEGQGHSKPFKRAKKLVREENRASESQSQQNQPLSFALKNLVRDHPFFDERGVRGETVEYFGLGYCTKGMLKDRIAIPLHNERGELVAYCGRAVTPEQIEAEKYKQPSGFKKMLVVYNLHRQGEGEKTFVLVESFISVWRLYQAGYSNALALMGSVLSDQQADLICNALGSDGRVVLLFDGDEDGKRCTEDCVKRLGQRLFVKVLDISPYARKPHQLTPEQVKELLK